ncbi:MAG: hypothetical protein AAF488_05125 [Planctomycetota bacterium]
MASPLREEPPLSVQVDPTLLTPRPSAPIPVTLTIDVSGSDLLQGRIRFEPTFGFPGYETAPLTLREGEQSYRCVLPAIEPGANDVAVPVIWYSADGAEFNLGRHVVAHSARALYPYAIARCRPVGSVTEIEPLELERVQQLRLQDRRRRSFGTQIHEFTPEEFPADVHSLCAYDMVVLPGSGLVELDPNALRRLEDWLRAGGVLAVALRPDLPADQRGFLDRVAGAIPEVDGVRSGAVDLGRVAIFSDGVDVPEDRRAEVVHELLRLRPTMRDRAQRGEALYHVESPFRGHEPTLPEAIAALPALLGMNDVEVLPVGVVVVFLLGLVLLVGPIDRVGLGWIRRRSWTWVTVPIVCIAATLVFVELSEWYVGANDTGSLTVIDLGEDGRVLRQYRFELSFPARHDVRQLQLSHQIVERFEVRDRYDPQPRTDSRIRGRFPAEYELAFGELKWTPYVLSRFRIGGPLFDESVAVPTIEPSPAEETPTVQLGGWGIDAQESVKGSYDRAVAVSVDGLRVRRRGARHRDDLGAQTIARMSTVPSQERGSLVSGVAPTGGRDLEGLPVAGEAEYVLGVLATRGVHHYFFRRKFEHE